MKKEVLNFFIRKGYVIKNEQGEYVFTSKYKEVLQYLDDKANEWGLPNDKIMEMMYLLEHPEVELVLNLTEDGQNEESI